MRLSVLVALVLSAFASPAVFGQAVSATGAGSTTGLVLGAAVSDSLAPGGKHTYTLQLESGWFVLGRVEQRTVDVVVRIQSPSGALAGSFDGPARGPEVFTIESDTAGVYRIEVTPFEREAGRYDVILQRMEPIALEPTARVDQIMSPWDRDDYPGGLVAVVRNGELAFARAYGMADLTHGVPFSVDTRTNIGSTSKQFTAYAILLLEREGRLSLDDDVRKHIPELPDLGGVVTLRHLLTHTSGYREFLNTLALTGRRFDMGDHIEPAELIEVVRRQPELQNPPGAEWNYNNTGYGLLAQVVERVSGTPFPVWMKENVFQPLGMTNTIVRAHPKQIVPNSSTGYVADRDGGVREAPDLAGAPGAGGMYTTVGDLAKWVRNFGAPRVGDSLIVAEMTSRYVLTSGDTTDYGLGLFIDSSRGLRRIHHGGADIAHRSMLAYYPELDAGVIALSNHGAFNAGLGAGGVALRVSEAFIGDRMEDPAGAVANAAGPFDPEQYDPESFDALAGHYALAAMPGLVIHAFREDAGLFVQVTGQGRVAIVPASDSTFNLQVVAASITFHRNRDGSADSLTLHQNGNHVARKVDAADAWSPTVSDLAAYSGRYFSTELEVFYDVLVSDSSLVVKVPRTDTLSLSPAERDRFTARGFPLAEIAFERDASGAAVAFTVSNVRARGVRFVRVE